MNYVRYHGKPYTVDDMVSSGVARRFLNISQTSLYRLSKEGKIPFIERKVQGVEYTYKVSELIKWAKERGIVPNTQYLVESTANA